MPSAGGRYTLMSSQKWRDPWYLSLTHQRRNLFDYLCECDENNCAGVYQCDHDVVRLKTKPWRPDAYDEAWRTLWGHANLYAGDWVWIVNYLKWNGGEKLSKTQAIGVVSITKRAPDALKRGFWHKYGSILTPAGYSIDTLCIGSEPKKPPKQPSNPQDMGLWIGYADPTYPYLALPSQSNPSLEPREGTRANSRAAEMAEANGFLKGPFTEAYCKHFPDMTPGMVPIKWGGDTQNLATAMKRGWATERITPLLDTYFASEDNLVRNNGYRAADFIRLLSGLEQAQKAGRVHGAGGGRTDVKRTTAGRRDKDWKAR